MSQNCMKNDQEKFRFHENHPGFYWEDLVLASMVSHLTGPVTLCMPDACFYKLAPGETEKRGICDFREGVAHMGDKGWQDKATPKCFNV